MLTPDMGAKRLVGKIDTDYRAGIMLRHVSRSAITVRWVNSLVRA